MLRFLHKISKNVSLHPYLVPDQAVAGRALLAPWHRAVVEVVLLTHVTAGAYKTWPTLAAAVVLALTRLGAFGVAIAGCKRDIAVEKDTQFSMCAGQQESLTFASRRTEAEEVDLTALALQAGDAGLTLALPCHDVTLAVGGANRVAVAAVKKGDMVSTRSTRGEEISPARSKCLNGCRFLCL